MSELRTWAKRVGALAATTLSLARNQEGRNPLKYFSAHLEKCVRYSIKNLDPSQKTLRPTWCPKLVTGLLCPDGPCVHLCDPVYMPSCIRPEVRLSLDERILCSDCCKIL